MKKIFYLLLFLLLSLPGIAQVNLDSLRNVWNDNNAPDTSRVLAIHELIRSAYLYSRPDSGLFYAQIMYDFSREKGFQREMTMALNLQAGACLMMGRFDDALKYYEQSVLISEKISDRSTTAKTLNNMGVVYSNKGNFTKALDYHLRSLLIKEEIGDKSGIAGSRNNIGLIYMNHGDYPNALDNFHRSLRIKEEFGDQIGIAQTLNNIGLIYMRQGDYINALEHFQRSLKICEQLDDKNGSAGILSNIGLIYMNQAEYSKALEYYFKSLEIQNAISHTKGMAGNYSNMGEIYMYQDSLIKAMEYFQKSLDIYEEIDDKRGLAGINTNIGRLKNLQGRYSQAVEWCKKGLLFAEEINILEEQKNACQCLYDAYKAGGNDNMALSFHERVVALVDSLKSKETTQKLQQMEFARIMQADSLMREEEKLRLQLAHDEEVWRKTRTKNIFIASAIILLLGAAILFWRMRYMRRAKKDIEKEKDRSEGLLLNILPAEIAQELKEKGKAAPRKFDNVSILFTDFKEFTKIAEKLSAEELVGEINSCFESFDSICKNYGIEKIKTIGDSYMAAGGLPVPSEDSVKNTVLAGLEMMDCMIRSKADKEAGAGTAFEMRIGIHTGSVIAGIVGYTKFQYDVWGDTVNTASRIENAGDTGKVNISQATYELIKGDPQFRFFPRGKVNTKGKGEMEMWFVERA